MSESERQSSTESGDILDWALVDSHGDLEDGDTSSTTSSVEVMAEEDGPQSESLTGSSTGPKFVLRLASREHLGPDSDEEASNGKTVTDTASIEVIPSSSISNQDGLPYVCVPTRRPRPYEGPMYRQQVSRENIEQLVQAITEVQSSVTKMEGQGIKYSPEGSARSLFGNNISQESQAIQNDTDTESLATSNSSRFSFLSKQTENQAIEGEIELPPNQRSRSPVDCDTESLESSVCSRFSFLPRERVDIDDSDTERLKTDSLPVIETLLPQENLVDRDPGTCSILYRAPQLPVQEEQESDDTVRPPSAQKTNDSILSTIKLLDKLFNISILTVVAVVVVMICSHKFSGPTGQTKIVDDEVNLLKSQKADAHKLITELRDDLLRQNNVESDLRHKNYVAVTRLEKSLKKCKISQNEAELENSDLKSEVIRLKYSVQLFQDAAPKKEPEESKVANGDTPYIQCGPGKVMKRLHEVDGDTIYFCKWDKSQGVPEEEKKEAPPGDSDLLAVEEFCEKILGDEGRETSRKYRKLKKSFKSLCHKALKQEDPDQPVANQQLIEDNTIPCQSCYQKLSEAENHWLNAVNEKEAAVSRAELWKELYTKAIEREAETSKADEEPDWDREPEDPSGEPVSLNSCWKFVLSNLTSGNHLFQSFGLYWEEVENLMPTNFSSLFDFWIHSKWRKPPLDTYWQQHSKDEEPEMYTYPDTEGEGPWTGSDHGEGPEGQSDWGDTVNSVLNKTKESVSTVNKQIQDTWKQVKNMSKHLWEKHEPSIIKMHNTFTEKISRLGEQFQEKLQKKTQHWFNRFNKKNGRNEDEGLRKQGPENKKGKHKKGCKSKGERGGNKQCKRGNQEDGENLRMQGPEGKKGKGQGCNKRKDKIERGKLNKKDSQMKKKGEKEEGTDGMGWQQPENIQLGQGTSGKTKRRQDLNVGGAVHHDNKQDSEKIIVLPYIGEPNNENQSEDKDLIPSCKFTKLKKAAKSLKWRTKNLDAWDNLAEEFRVIGERLLMNDVYQEEEDLPSDQQKWYNCQLTWWHNNLQGGGGRIPDHCHNRLEQFQRDRKVVDPKYWMNQRMLDNAGDLNKDVCFYEKLEAIFHLLQHKLDLFQIDMCRHRVPPCTYREHLYMNMDELRELFQQDSEAGSQSEKGPSIQRNWLFERAQYREHLRDNLDDDDDVKYRYQTDAVDDDDDDDDDDDIHWGSMDERHNDAKKEDLDDDDDDYDDDDALVEDEFDFMNLDL